MRYLVFLTACLILANQAPAVHVTASWYGQECAGRKTASGAIFDPARFTAASWKHYGKRLKVSNSRGDSVIVFVNDKGPARRLLKTRQIDLSRAAFEQLAPLWTGLIRVKVELLK